MNPFGGDISDTAQAGLGRRSLIAALLVGGAAIPFLARQGLLFDAQVATPPPRAPAGSVNVCDFLDPRQLADVRDGRGTIDVTQACQRALRAARQVHFPAGTYLLNAAPEACLRVGSNQTITLAEGAVLKARSNALEQYYVLLVENVRNVLIEGGAILGERHSHRGKTGEHGMGIGIFGSANVTLRGVTVRDSWGDGIYVGGRGFDGQSSNVRIEQCLCDGNRRQGLTIAAVDGCTVTGGRFVRTRGAMPASGIDIEPNYGVTAGIKRPKRGATNVTVEGAECTDNQGHGLTVSQVHTRTVRIRGLKAHRNGMSGISCGYPGGDLEIERPDCRDNGEHGITIFGAPTYVTRDIRVTEPACMGNGRSGISVGLNVDGFSVSGGLVAGNGEEGIVCNGTGGKVCGNGVIERVRIEANSQKANAAYDNLLIGPVCDRIVVQNNDIEEGAGARKPRYGLNIATNGAVTVVGNDLRSAGARAAVRGLDQARVVARENLRAM